MQNFSSLNHLVIIGGGAAMLAALLWSIAAVIFQKLGEDIPPAELNLLKGLLAVSAMIVTSLILRESYPSISTSTLVLLAVSGIVGIGVGDTAFFHSLNYLGTRLALLMGVLAPPMAGLISWIFLGEVLKPVSWLGILITMVGVGWVILQENRGEGKIQHLGRGILVALLASLSQSIGAMLSRYALVSSDISALQTAIVRLLAGIISLVIVILFIQKTRFEWLSGKERGKPSVGVLIRNVALVGLIGTYSAIWLQQISLEYAPVGIAQTLLSTSPIFILPIVALRGEKVSWKAVLGALVSMTGVVILFSAG
jgi:drug/metabolite transporter (DMT)-like permease